MEQTLADLKESLAKSELARICAICNTINPNYAQIIDNIEGVQGIEFVYYCKYCNNDAGCLCDVCGIASCINCGDRCLLGHKAADPNVFISLRKCENLFLKFHKKIFEKIAADGYGMNFNSIIDIDAPNDLDVMLVREITMKYRYGTLIKSIASKIFWINITTIHGSLILMIKKNEYVSGLLPERTANRTRRELAKIEV
jgi:hypothetical protein